MTVPADPARWARIEALFNEGLALDPAHRRAWLATACDGDGALRDEVSSLLDEHAAEPAFLEATPHWLDATAEERIQPARIGAYRVLRALGRGGMGQVWLAEREAPGFRQHVAVKVIRRGMDTDDLVARFRTERQILASLDHPNIARLLDVGATPEGLPFLVMEYVDGAPLLEYCRRADLSIAARVRLFRSICAAVHSAHRSLIVHRDIKPRNILVTAAGVPKLLDFGIAKILDPDLRALASHQTHVDVRALTPDYASPEQLRGLPTTTACDVWALGVLLYELLCGLHPFAREGQTRAETERRVLETDAPPPSTRTDPHRARLLRGDLDNIVLKALRREPEARYASALSLSEDLERHLAGLPVLARPATARYRAGRFVRRNRLAVAAGLAVFGVLAGSTALSLRQAQRIREESMRVARERDKALEVRSFLLEMFGSTGPDQPTGDTVTARQLLDRRAASLASTYADDAELRADMMVVLAEGYEKLGLLAQAEPMARAALETRRDLFGAEHPDVAIALDRLGWILHERGDLVGADSLLRAAVDIGRRTRPGGDPDLARALNDLGVVREAQGSFDEAAALYRESLDLRRLLRGDDHLGVAITTSNLAVVLYRQGDLDGAVAMGESALALFRRSLGPDHQRTTVVQNNLAAFQSAAGDHRSAAVQHRDILERRRRSFGPRNPSAAFSMTSLAHELLMQQRHAEAEALLIEALAIQREAYGDAHGALATTLRVLGDVKRATGRNAAALADFREALRVTRIVYGPEHPQVANLIERINALTSDEQLRRVGEVSVRH